MTPFDPRYDPLLPPSTQLISESYDILKNVGGLTNEELATVFSDWNSTELQSYLIEITSLVRPFYNPSTPPPDPL